MHRAIIRLVAITSLLAAAGASASAAIAGGGCHGSGAAATEASSAVVKIDGCTFAPTIDRVPVGTTVTFLNSGPVPHDVSGAMGEWGSGLLESGQSYRTAFAKPGIYAYSCSLHPGMAGAIVAESITADPLVSQQDPVAPRPAGAADGGPIPAAVLGGGGLVLGVLGTAFLLRRRDPNA